MDSKKKLQDSIRLVMKKEDIMSFVNGLHEIQMDMIEMTVESKQRDGFPEANSVIKHIMEKK